MSVIDARHPVYGPVRSCRAHDPEFDRPKFEIVMPPLEGGGRAIVHPVTVDDSAAWLAPGYEYVLEWRKCEGDLVARGEPLGILVLYGGGEAIVSPVDGVLIEIRVKRGVVPKHGVLAVVARHSAPGLRGASVIA